MRPWPTEKRIAMHESTIIRVSRSPTVRLQDVYDGMQCAIVDDFLDDPELIVSKAFAYAGDFVSEPRGHPSRGKDIDQRQLEEIKRYIRSEFSRKFPFHRAGIMIKAFLSNVSLKPEELSVSQRMCHIDPKLRPDCDTYAGVIYLFENPDLGGTAFYRWRAKQLAIDAYQLSGQGNDAALRYLREHSEYFRKPPEYMTSSNDIAELHDVIPAKFNRLVFYSGEIPHSGHITRPDLLSDDPAKGRLTLNIFVSVRARHTGYT